MPDVGTGDLLAGMTPEQWAALSGPGVPWVGGDVVAKGVADIPRRFITSIYSPGLRREDVTDIPAQGGWARSFGSQPNDPAIAAATDAAGLAQLGGLAGVPGEAGTVLTAGMRRRPLPVRAAPAEELPPPPIGHNMPPEPIPVETPAATGEQLAQVAVKGGQAPYLYHVSTADNLAGIGSAGLNKGTFFATEAPSHIGNVEIQQQFPTFRTIQSGNFKPEGNRGPLHPDFISTAQISPENLEILQGDKWVPFGQSTTPATTGEQIAQTVTKSPFTQWREGLPTPQPAAQSTAIPDIRGLPVDQAIDLARTQPHLIKSGERGEGLYVGGPRNIETQRGLTETRKAFDQYLGADPRGGDWYDRYRAGMTEVTGGDPLQNKWMANQEGQWSAGVDPGSELHFALKENNASIAGMPVKAARPAQHEAHLAAVAAKDPSLYQLGDKTGEYAVQVNPDQLNPPGATGVNDFRHAINFRYTEPSGAPQREALGPAGHKFLDMETALAVDRANRAGLGGRTDWTGEQLQAAPWVRQKALDIMSRNPALTYAEAFARANRTIADYFDAHTAFATHEDQPGANVLGHMMGSIAATPEQRVAFAGDPRSGWATAPGARDAIYSGMGIPGTGVNMRVRPTKPMQGMYVTPEGKTETNPGGVARPLVTFNTGKDPFKVTTPADQSLLNAGEALRSYIDAQNAGAWHKPWAGGQANQSTSLFFPRSGPSNAEELLALRKALEPHGLTDIVDTGQGVTATRFYPGQPEPSNAFNQALRKGQFSQFGEPTRVRVGPGDSGYIDNVEAWQKGVGSGAATKQLLDYVNKTPEIRAALNNNPYLGERALARVGRDEDWAATWGAPRVDIQNARKIIGDGPGWIDRLEAGLKNGAILPAVGAAILGADALARRQAGSDGGS